MENPLEQAGNIHGEHRCRVRQRFEESGLDDFTQVQVLELLLFYAIPRRDTNPAAHELIARFGSLAGVLEAPLEELEQVPGVGHNAALLLSMMPQLGRYYMTNRAQVTRILNTVDLYGDYLMPCFFGRKTEVVYLLCLDAKCKPLSCRMVGEGDVNSAAVPIRRIVEMALASNSTMVVLAHNHPSGLAIPSPEDVQTTLRLREALQVVDISLTDHLIIADDDYISMFQSGYLPR